MSRTTHRAGYLGLAAWPLMGLDFTLAGGAACRLPALAEYTVKPRAAPGANPVPRVASKTMSLNLILQD